MRSIKGYDGSGVLGKKDGKSERTLWVIVVDDNMQYRRMRYFLYQVSRREGIGYATVYLDMPLRDVLIRNSRRQMEEGSVAVPRGVIEKMATIFEAPNGHRFSWEKHTVVLHPAGSDQQDSNDPKDFLEAGLLEMWKVVNEALKDTALDNSCYFKVEAHEKSEAVDIHTAAASSSARHATDLALRCEVSNIMQREMVRGHTREELRAIAHTCSAAKVKVLSMNMKSADCAIAEFHDQLKNKAA